MKKGKIWMKSLNLRVLKKLFQGLLDGSLKLMAVPTGKKPKKVTVSKAVRKTAKKGKPGRKPLSKTEKNKLLKARKRANKPVLPSPRDIFVFMQEKYAGVKLTQLASHFKLKRTQLKGLVAKLVKKKDLSDVRGTLFLERRLRNVGSKIEKPIPVSEDQVLGYLKKNSPATLTDMAKDMGEESYHRFIRVVNRLEKNGKVAKDGKAYSLN